MKLACWLCLVVCSCCTTNFAAELVIESVAGTGAPENNGDTGPASTINIGDPFGVEIGPDHALYITEVRNHRVRRLEIGTGILSTVAGCGRKGYSGDGGPAVDAELNEPYEVRFDLDGNMYIVEMQNHIVRRIDAETKTIATIAGTGRRGFSGDGGAATKAQLSQPHSIALDSEGALYIADIGNHRIRRIDTKNGVIESIAGGSEQKMPRDGQAARGNPILGPRALYIDGDTLWIALREGHSIWRMDLDDGIFHHVAGSGVPGFEGDGGPAKKARFNGPKGIAVGPYSNVFVVDSENNAIRMIDQQSGLISTIAGRKGLVKGGADHSEKIATKRLNQPHGICVSLNGSIYVGDTLNQRVVRLR